jgi:hypothetical protein
LQIERHGLKRKVDEQSNVVLDFDAQNQFLGVEFLRHSIRENRARDLKAARKMATSE